MSQRSTRIAAVCSALVLVGALSATPAMAQEPDLTSKTLPSDGEVCAVVAQPTPAGQNIAFTPAPTTTCFDSIGEALESVLGEPVTDPGVLEGDPSALREYFQERDATTRSSVAAATTASRPLGVSYKGTNLAGDGKVYFGQGTGGCEGTITYGFPRLASYLYNNIISSMATYANCWSTLYDLENYVKGTSTNCVPDCWSLGSMNNRASSIVFRPAGTID